MWDSEGTTFMSAPRLVPDKGRRLRLLAGCAAAACGLLAAGCGGPTAIAKPAAHVTITSCGNARTAAGVPVRIQLRRGAFSCATAMTVEGAYDKAIREGRAPGNGGGGPVSVRGWTCQGFTTPVVLKTGDASKCVHGSDEFLAILPTPA